MEKVCFLAGRKDSLFKQLVASLLRDLADNLKLHESQADDFEGLLNEVLMVKPNVILLEDTSPFSKKSFLVRLLVSKPNLPVIVISENSNEIHILRRETVLLSSSSELIRAIDQIQFQPDTPGG